MIATVNLCSYLSLDVGICTEIGAVIGLVWSKSSRLDPTFEAITVARLSIQQTLCSITYVCDYICSNLTMAKLILYVYDVRVVKAQGQINIKYALGFFSQC